MHSIRLQEKKQSKTKLVGGGFSKKYLPASQLCVDCLDLLKNNIRIFPVVLIVCALDIKGRGG